MSDLKAKPRTPAANQSANEPAKTKEFTLSSGKKCVKLAFKGKHVREAIRLGAGDEVKGVFAMIATTVTIDGNRITIEEIDEMDGADVLELMAEFQGLF